MRVLMTTAILSAALLSSSAALACADRSPAPSKPAERYVPATPTAAPELAIRRGPSDALKLAGAGIGGALLAGSVAWTVARRRG